MSRRGPYFNFQVPTPVAIGLFEKSIETNFSELLVVERPSPLFQRHSRGWQITDIMLNNDVLAYIFQLNTYSTELAGEPHFLSAQNPSTSALDVARHTSQVCRSWRELLLQTPTIWGNLIDMERLSQASYLWVEEVIKRTGCVNLSIYGPVGHSPESRSLFVSLLNAHWHRVRRLGVKIKKAKQIDPNIWDIFWRLPATNLETFIVTGCIPDYILPLSPTALDAHPPLFAGTAPSLRHIHCPPNFTFDHHTVWISQLLSLTLSGPLTTVEALDVISRCPRLESLEIQPTVEVYGKTWTRTIRLPYLHQLLISSDAMGSLVYLSNVVANSDCTLILTVRESLHNLRDIVMLQRLSNMAVPYAKNYFDIHHPTELAINIEALDIRITARTLGEFGGPKFSINLRSMGQYQSFDPRIFDIILSTISSAAFGTVSHMRFALSHLTWSITSEGSIRILQSLTSITKLTVTPWAMTHLRGMATSATLFPRLVEVGIQYHNRDQHFNFEKRLVMFLENRTDAGNPVQTLDVRKYIGVQGRYRWEFLEGMRGLNIVKEPTELQWNS